MKSFENDEYSFYAGRLSEEEISRKEEDQSLYEFGGDLFKNEVNFSAFGDDCALRGNGTLIDDPKVYLRVNMDENKDFIHDAKNNKTSLVEDPHSVVMCHVRVISDRRKYIDKDGKQRIYKQYGYVPILANSVTAKKDLIRFAEGDHIEFRGAFISKQLKDENGKLTNNTTFYCLLRQFNGYPVKIMQRRLEKALGKTKAKQSYHKNNSSYQKNETKNDYQPKVHSKNAQAYYNREPQNDYQTQFKNNYSDKQFEASEPQTRTSSTQPMNTSSKVNDSVNQKKTEPNEKEEVKTKTSSQQPSTGNEYSNVSSNTRETNEVKHEKTIKEPVNRTSSRQAENQSSSMNGNSATATSPNTNAQSQTKDDDSSNDDSMKFACESPYFNAGRDRASLVAFLVPISALLPFSFILINEKR